MLEDLRDYGLIKQRTVRARAKPHVLILDSAFHGHDAGDLTEV